MSHQIPSKEKRRFPPKTFLPWLGVVLLGGLFAGMTAPGQTAGLSVFTDPVIRDLSISRQEISFAYLLATFIGALAMPITGKLLDRFGTGRIIQLAGLGLATFLFFAAIAQEIFGLTISYMGLRLFGQGALSLAATTMVAKLVSFRSGLALGIAAAIGAALVSLAPVFAAISIEVNGHRTTWLLEAALVLLLVVGLGFAVPRARVEYTETGSIAVVEHSGHTLRFALQSGMFWVISAAIVAMAMLFTGLAFHLISILGQQGLDPVEAAANFLPQTLTSLVLTVMLGGFIDKGNPRWGVSVAMGLLIASLLMLPFVEPGFMGVVFGLVLGAAAGAMKGVEAATLVKYFGAKEIGAIRGVITSIGIVATGLGPIYFSIGFDLSGDYTTAAAIAALLPAGVIVACWFVRDPVSFTERPV